MNGPGYISQVDVDILDGKKVDNVSLVTDSTLGDAEGRNLTAAKDVCISYGVNERDMLENQKVESSSNAISDNHPANQETKHSVSTSPSTTAELIDEDEVEYKVSTQNSSLNSTPPPTAYDFDKWLYHTGLKEWGSDLHEAAKAVFPNTASARYRNVYVLMLKWEDEDPNLPVSREIRRLFGVFQDLYHFQTEVWDIKDLACHAEVNQKILDFSRLGGDSKEDLKIIYYAGHGKLTKNRLLSWTR
jgi:hypothetical protein